jgi:hypothetical protein
MLAISGVSRGCAIPVAWAILPANVPPARRRDWLCMLRQQRRATYLRLVNIFHRGWLTTLVALPITTLG